MNADKSSLSQAQSYQEIGEHWDSHDLGEVWDEVCMEIVDDRVKLLRRAMKAAEYLKQFDESITWRDVLNAGLGAQQPGAAMQQQANEKKAGGKQDQQNQQYLQDQEESDDAQD